MKNLQLYVGAIVLGVLGGDGCQQTQRSGIIVARIGAWRRKKDVIASP
jgi:hypothetical protein